MVQSSRAKQFYTSDDGVFIRQELENMMSSLDFNTKSTYTPTSEENQLFVEKHMKYLSLHASVNPRQYLSNLKLMTRITTTQKKENE